MKVKVSAHRLNLREDPIKSAQRSIEAATGQTLAASKKKASLNSQSKAKKSS